ncbi:MAG: ATP-binding protein [Sphaerochaeta sp.]|nr:ATP-binding protein [Sphaerochaeta sp.]
MHYIQRSMETLFLQLTEEYGAILLTGPRQAGKTTMLKHLMEGEPVQRRYVSLDDLNARALAQTDPTMFFQIYPPPVLIDEVQYAPQLFPVIKMFVDNGQKRGDFWLTGSQLFKLMDGVRESLAGRVAVLQLYPLSQDERYTDGSAGPFTVDLVTLQKRQEMRSPASGPEIFTRIFEGGMPALASGSITGRSQYYSSYLATYLERDVRIISPIVDSLKFLHFITAVAARTAQLVNYASIAADSGIDQTTAKHWLSILEALGIIFYLHPYSNNVLKRTIRTPKLYFYDTALVCYLTKWLSAETAMMGAMNGALLETYVVSEIMKSYRHVGLDVPLYYYRDKDGREIDLLLERDGHLHPIEIKKSALPNRSDARAFGVLDKGPLLRGKGAIICLAEELGALDGDTLIVGAHLV